MGWGEFMTKIGDAEKTGVYMYVIDFTLNEEKELAQFQTELGLTQVTQRQQQQPQKRDTQEEVDKLMRAYALKQQQLPVSSGGKSRRRHRRGHTLHKRRKSRKVRKTRCRRGRK